MTAECREQIEFLLQRPLTDEELIVRPSLKDLSSLQAGLARTIRRKQLVLCALYLLACSATWADVTAWIADDELGDPEAWQ